MRVEFSVNGRSVDVDVEPRTTLLDTLRDHLDLTGTKVGCEHGVCGCCNVLLGGVLARSCLLLTFQAAGQEITTVEGVEGPGGALSPLQEALCRHHAMQCGYCTPGIVMAMTELLAEHPEPRSEQVVEALSGSLCRCTGYQQILEALDEFVAAEGD